MDYFFWFMFCLDGKSIQNFPSLVAPRGKVTKMAKKTVPFLLQSRAEKEGT